MQNYNGLLTHYHRRVEKNCTVALLTLWEGSYPVLKKFKLVTLSLAPFPPLPPRNWTSFLNPLTGIRDHYDVIIMVFMARLLFNQWYACSGGRHLVDHVSFQSEPSAPSVIHMEARVTSRSTFFSAAHHHNLFIYWNYEFLQFFYHLPFRLPVNHSFLFVCSKWRFPPPPYLC